MGIHMKKITQVLLTASLISLSMTSSADEVKTPATALTKCKAEAKIVHPNQTKIVHKKIKQLRGKFKINLRVSTPNGKVKTLCEITTDGKITYSAR